MASEGVGEHGLGDAAIPARGAADLVVMRPTSFFRPTPARERRSAYTSAAGYVVGRNGRGRRWRPRRPGQRTSAVALGTPMSASGAGLANQDSRGDLAVVDHHEHDRDPPPRPRHRRVLAGRSAGAGPWR